MAKRVGTLQEKYSKGFRIALATLVLLPVAVLALHCVRVHFHDLSRWKGGGMGMFSTQDALDTRFVSVWLETEAGEFVASRGSIGTPLGRYEAEPTAPNLQALCRHLGESVWIDDRRSKTAIHTESAEPVPVAAIQHTASVEGEPLIIQRIRVSGLKLKVDVASGRIHYQTLGSLSYDASTASCDESA